MKTSLELIIHPIYLYPCFLCTGSHSSVDSLDPLTSDVEEDMYGSEPEVEVESHSVSSSSIGSERHLTSSVIGGNLLPSLHGVLQQGRI